MSDPVAPPRAPALALQPAWYPLLQLTLAGIAWPIGIASAGRQQYAVAPLLAAALVALHLAVSRRRGDELRLIISALMIGLLADALLCAAGLVVPAPFTGEPAPLWQLSLWTLPGAALHTYLRWMGTRRARAIIIASGVAALGGLAGQLLGALRFPAGLPAALGGIALTWSVAMPLLLSACARIDRLRQSSGPAAVPAQSR